MHALWQTNGSFLCRRGVGLVIVEPPYESNTEQSRLKLNPEVSGFANALYRGHMLVIDSRFALALK